MPFNRIGNFYIGQFTRLELNMTLDEENAELNSLLDARLSQLNAVIEEHESNLKAMMIPEPVWLEYQHYADDYDPQGTGWLIGIDKWQGTWRLCHARDNYIPTGEYSDIKPLVDASIFDRRRAIKKIDELRQKIVTDKKKLIPLLEKDIEVAAKALDNYPKRTKKA